MFPGGRTNGRMGSAVGHSAATAHTSGGRLQQHDQIGCSLLQLELRSRLVDRQAQSDRRQSSVDLFALRCQLRRQRAVRRLSRRLPLSSAARRRCVRQAQHGPDGSRTIRSGCSADGRLGPCSRRLDRKYVRTSGRHSFTVRLCPSLSGRIESRTALVRHLQLGLCAGQCNRHRFLRFAGKARENATIFGDKRFAVRNTFAEFGGLRAVVRFLVVRYVLKFSFAATNQTNQLFSDCSSDDEQALTRLVRPTLQVATSVCTIRTLPRSIARFTCSVTLRSFATRLKIRAICSFQPMPSVCSRSLPDDRRSKAT
jgi:hypothetical protein